jgi:putative ABC transport system permease protein
MPSHTNAEGQSLRDASPVEAMKTRLAAIPGVRAVAASWTTPDSHHDSDTIAMVPAHPDRPQVTLERIFVDYGFLELYGLKPIAGRSLDEGFADDAASEAAPHRELSTLINETAVRVFGFGSPQAAIGQEIGMPQDDGTTDLMRVVGVVPDFSFNGVRDVVTPTSYTIDSASFDVLSLKLSGTAVPETLAAIDRVWRDFVPNRPIDRSFVDDAVQRLYRDIIRQGTLFAVFAGVAMVIGCLGLFGLSAFTAERRTKEIGVRKALGASTADVVRLLVWQFVKPVLLANLIAWPIAWWAMRGWLDGFAYRIELDPILFLAAGLGALAIAIGTTAFHAIQVARSRPVLALRYE